MFNKNINLIAIAIYGFIGNRLEHLIYKSLINYYTVLEHLGFCL